LWARRNLVGKPSRQAFSDRHGDRRYGHVFPTIACGLDLEDAPHEYAGCPTLVELAVDEDKSFCSAGDAPGFRLIGRELPLDKPLEDGEAPIRIFEVHFW
jgi:hypothetical protein